MKGSADLMLFEHLLRKPDSEIDLERAALLVAESEYPGLDVARYITKLDELAGIVARRVEALDVPRDDVPRMLECVLRCLYGDLGFRGNTADYYDPCNSFLNEVLERRTGIPITLAIVVAGVCGRLGMDARGVSFPGHFLVRVATQPGTQPGTLMFIDPFDGHILNSDQIEAMHAQATGHPGGFHERCLDPAGRPQIVARMLNNLRAIYEVRGDRARLQRTLEYLAVVHPSEAVRLRLDTLGQTSEPLAPRISLN